MKFVLAALNAKYVHSNLAVYDLEAYGKERRTRDDIELVVKEYTINHNLDFIGQSLYREKAEVLAFSCYIWNIQEVLMVAGELKKVSPAVHIWLGGPEVSYNGEQMLAEYPFIEGIMLGEGEITFFELMQAWAGTGEDGNAGLFMEYEGIPGICYRDEGGKPRTNPARAPLPMDEVPFIYQDLSKFENRILYYETSRGCPFSCSYCLSSIEKGVRFRSLSLVERELSFFLQHRVPQVRFIDRTFNCNREHALAVWRFLLEHDNGVTNFHFEVAADLIGEEELALFRRMRPGLIQLEIGLQSTNPATLKEIRRVTDIGKLKDNMLKVHGFSNIHQHLDLIAGLPYEDFKSFQKSFQDAYEMKPDQLQLGFLKVLKGSYMETQKERYGLICQDRQPFEVLSTKWLSYDEILVLKKVEEMVEMYFNSNQFEHALPYLVSFFGSAFECFEEMGQYYEQNGLFGIGTRREMRYEALMGFAAWRLGGLEGFSWDIFDSLLRYDYYLRENAKSRPSFSGKEPVEKSAYQSFFKNGGTEEYALGGAGYDSKAAARKMHIEPVVKAALPWMGKDAEMMERQERGGETVYCLFDYEKRSLLTKNAAVFFLSHL